MFFRKKRNKKSTLKKNFAE